MPTDQNPDRKRDENLDEEIVLSGMREERATRRDHVRHQDESKTEDISKEEEEQIRQAIELSMMCQSEPQPADKHTDRMEVIQQSMPTDGDHPESVANNSVQSPSSQTCHQVVDGDDDENIEDSRSGGDKNNDQCQPVSEGDDDVLYHEDENIDDHEREAEATFPSQESNEDGDDATEDQVNEDDDDDRSSPLLFQTPSKCDVGPTEDEEMTQISIQSSVHSELDIFVSRKDKLSLKKRKREAVELEQPKKTARVEAQVKEYIHEDVPLICVDRRPIQKSLKPFFAADTEDKEMYTSVILNMLNQQLRRLRSAQNHLNNYVAFGPPVEVGPVMRGCLRHRRRREKPFVFFDSDDEEEIESAKQSPLKTVEPSASSDGGSVVKIDPVDNRCNADSARKRRMQSIIDDMSDLSDFESIPKKPKLTEQTTSPEHISQNEILDDDDDDVLYAGETLPLFEDEGVNEQLEDALLNDSPVPIVVKESDQESDDGHDTDTQEMSGSEIKVDRSSNHFELKPEKSYEEKGLLHTKHERTSREKKSRNDMREHLAQVSLQRIQTDRSCKRNVNYAGGQQDGSDSDGSTSSGVVILEGNADDNNQGFFARKRQVVNEVSGTLTSRIIRHRTRELSPVIPVQISTNEHLLKFDMEKNGIACPLCNVQYHPDMIERHASECNGAVEEAIEVEPEPVVANEVINSEPEYSTSQMERDHEDGWLFNETKVTPVAKYGRKDRVFKPAEQGDVYKISDSSDEEDMSVGTSKRRSHGTTRSGSDHVDQVVSEMIGRKQLSISLPKANKKQRTKHPSKKSDAEEDMETCFMCNKLIPKSMYPAHVNAELERQNRDESLHVESQQPPEPMQGPRLRKRNIRNVKKEEEEEEEEEMEEGDLDDLIAFSKEKNQDDDYNLEEDDNDGDVEIDEESDGTNDGASGGEIAFDVSDSPIKAFRSIKNTRAGFIDYNNQFNNKPKTRRVTEKSFYPSTSKPQGRGRRRGRGRGGGRGRFRKKK